MNIDKVDTSVNIYHSIPETAKMTGLSKYYLKKLISEGKISTLRNGRKYLINVPSLTKQLQALEGNGEIDGSR